MCLARPHLLCAGGSADSVGWRRIHAVYERAWPGFWDAPVNAITHVAFLPAAWLAE
jgi:hypothetical protein